MSTCRRVRWLIPIGSTSPQRTRVSMSVKSQCIRRQSRLSLLPVIVYILLSLSVRSASDMTLTRVKRNVSLRVGSPAALLGGTQGAL